MDKKYLKYTLEELLDDKHFVAWVLKGHKRNEWNSFIKEYPEIKARAKKAEKIIHLLKDTYDILDEEDIFRIWQNIDHFNKAQKHKARTIQLRRSISIAASVLIIVSLGVFGYSYLKNNNKEYQFTSTDIPAGQEESRLILSNGEEFELEKDESTVSLNNNNTLVINNENTIDLSGKEAKEVNKTRMNEVVVPYGKRTELMLADGTKVWLNAGSRLAFPTKFTNETREVYLTGEGCFKVTKNESQPFIVNANDLGIKVLGTHFNVAAYPDDESIETILVEGSVELSKRKTFGLSSKSVVLKPLQKATFSKDEKEIIVTNEPDADVYIAWTEGWFTFSQQSLEQVFTKLERFYNVEIIVPLNFPSNEKITGKLDLKDSLEDVFKALSDVAKINYRITEDKVLVDKKVEEIPMK
ncbi:FecR domain-containing protein [uncultured Draconibacterium sp.]|uniref:FecR family protein n=1 Tax=uncultured Draconibacterium sp. TaxID=1573823 RepID=UPI003216768D